VRAMGMRPLEHGLVRLPVQVAPCYEGLWGESPAAIT